MSGDEPRRGGVRAAARNLGWLLSSKGLGAVLGLLYLGITTRALGLKDFGRFALITGASEALITLIAFPTWQIVIQFGVAHQLNKDEGALGRLFRACAALDVFAASVGAVIVCAVLALFAGLLRIKPDLVPYILAFSLIQLISLRSTALGMLRLRDAYARAALADSTLPVVRTLGTIAAWLVSPTIAGFLAAWAAAELATAFAFWRQAARDGDVRRLLGARITRQQVLAENPGFFRFAFSTNANVALNLSQKEIPLLLVGAFAGPKAAGSFSLAFQVAKAMAKLGQMMTRAAFPELVHAVRRNPARKVRRLLLKMVAAASGAALAIMLLVVVAGKPVLGLIGGAPYIPAYPILLWIAAAGCLEFALIGFEPVLMALHRAGTAFLVRVVSAVVLVGATVILTPQLGGIGAGMALLIGTAVAQLLLAVVTFRAVAAMPAEAVLEPETGTGTEVSSAPASR